MIHLNAFLPHNELMSLRKPIVERVVPHLFSHVPQQSSQRALSAFVWHKLWARVNNSKCEWNIMYQEKSCNRDKLKHFIPTAAVSLGWPIFDAYSGLEFLSAILS